MTAVWFLLGALLLSAIGSAVIVLRQRNPTDEDWSVEEFRREMHALSPEATRVRRMPPPVHPRPVTRPAQAPRHARPRAPHADDRGR